MVGSTRRKMTKHASGGQRKREQATKKSSNYDPNNAVRRAGAGKRNRKHSASARNAREMKKRGSLLVENTKKAMMIRGPKTNEMIVMLMKDFYKLKSPDAVMMSRKNQVRPFEDGEKMQFMTQKNDCSLFCYVSHSKKRPNNVVLGRMFDWQMLDMMELGVERFIGMETIQGPSGLQGGKPLFVFQGDEFEHDESFKTLKNLLLDFFRGAVVSEVNRAGMDHVCVCSSHEGKCHMRWYFISQDADKVAGSKCPKATLSPMGPMVDFTLRRSQAAASDLRKAAMRVPKELKKKRQKNVSYDSLGNRVGRLHVERQDLGELQTRKSKALKIGRANARAALKDSSGGGGRSAKRRKTA